MNPLVVIAAIQATAVAISDVCKVLLSPEGQKAMAQWNEDAKEFRRVVNAIGAWFENTFKVQVAIAADEKGNVTAGVTATGGAK